MTKTALVFAASIVLLAGAAWAAGDQSLIVDGKVKTPATGEQPISAQQTGIPKPDAVPIGTAIDELNVHLDELGLPAEVQQSDEGIRPNLRCSVGMPEDACVSDEPTVPWARLGIVSVGPDGIALSEWIGVQSGEVLQILPEEAWEQVPEEHRGQLESAAEEVNGAVDARFEDGSGGEGKDRSRVRTPIGDITFDSRLGNLLGSTANLANLVPEGAQEQLPEGFDELFNEQAPGFTGIQDGAGAGSSGASAEGGAGAEGDLVGMAIMAAVVGGVILGPAALYHRIRSNHALNNKTRQAVFDSVVRSPGLGVSEAAKAAGCSYSTAAYHLERLVDERLIVASEDGRRARYFKNGGAFSQAEREFVPILQSDECMAVLQTIVENPWCYRAEVAQKLGVSGPTVNWHLKKLMTAGVVKEMREGRISYLYADKKHISAIGANLVGKMPEDVVAKLRFERRPQAELVEPALGLPETGVPEVGTQELQGDIELAPLPDSN